MAQAIPDGFAAVNKAFAVGGPILAGLVGIATAANVAKIASAQPPSFQEGGFFNGSGITGDRNIARVNDKEAVLNSRQQREFMRLANGGGSNNNDQIERLIEAVNSQKVSVEIDGRQIAETVREQSESGFAIA